MVTEQTLETVFKELDEVVKKLEGENVSLEESFQLYHKGMDLLKVCNEKIDTVEKKMMILDENGEQHEF
ncbi:MAG: exodeoxyribonuclease VII small subunit [Tyzzerella sp.]|nr:exodeoxyribonuclease VII small subunit [Tyzzerella sp.]